MKILSKNATNVNELSVPSLKIKRLTLKSRRDARGVLRVAVDQPEELREGR